MRTSLDVYRSLKRYVALALPDSFEVRLEVEEGTFQRPYAVIIQPPGGTNMSGTAQATDNVKTFVINVFPDKQGSVEESLFAASEIEKLLANAFRTGIAGGRAARMPLYDYEGLPFTVGAGEDELLPHTFAKILDLSIDPRQSPSDELLFTVIAEVRIGWRADSRLPSAGEVATDVRITQEPT